MFDGRLFGYFLFGSGFRERSSLIFSQTHICRSSYVRERLLICRYSGCLLHLPNFDGPDSDGGELDGHVEVSSFTATATSWKIWDSYFVHALGSTSSYR